MTDATRADDDWDAGDLGCGDLVIALRLRMRAMQPGQIIRVHATDSGAKHDLPAWCRMTGSELVRHDPSRDLFWIRR
ncbi:MAG: sulfurtransferase TusA family protein [Betaproteobacteria bacterium]|nr:sulfurtransferase TusA family protein [Betaproteobacteria bacterium]